jgi:hypothetical protein
MLPGYYGCYEVNGGGSDDCYMRLPPGVKKMYERVVSLRRR